MRKIFKVFTLLFLTTFILSCSNLSNQEEKKSEKETTIEFDFGSVISKILKNSKNHYNKNNLSRNISPDMKSRTAGDDDLTQEQIAAITEALEFSLNVRVSLSGGYEDTVTQTYTVDIFDETTIQNPVLQFSAVPVGVRVKARADITTNVEVKSEDSVAALVEALGISIELLADTDLCDLIAEELTFSYSLTGESEETTIQAGTNQISIPMTLVEADEPGTTGDPTEPGSQSEEQEQEEEEEEEDPSIPLEGSILAQYADKLIILINQEESDSRFYLNKGKLVFKLIDEDGNNLLANQENSRVDWTYKLTLRNTEIPKSGASGLRYEANTSEGSFEIKDMPAAGNYQLYVQAQKFDNGTHSPSAPTSAVFDLPVENTTYYSFSVNSSDGDNYIDLGPNGGGNSNRVILSSVDSNVDLKLTGEYEGGITSILMNLQQYLHSTFYNKSFTFEIDLSEITGTDTYNSVDSYALHDLDMVTSFKMPETATSYSMAIFQQCTNLEYVRFGEATKDLSKMSIGSGSDCLFQGCSSLKAVEFAKTDGWYSAPEGIRTDLIDWTTLTVPKYNSLNQPVTENGEQVFIQLTSVDVSDPEANATHIIDGDWGYLYRKTE